MKERILTLSVGALMALGTVAVAAQEKTATRDGSAAPEVFVVQLVDISPTEFEYRPAHITVRQGSVVRFVQTGVMPHNVEFRDTPSGVDFGASRVGPFIIQKGAVYEIEIDERFKIGDYAFVCTPHEFMGMKGTLTVVASEGRPASTP